GDHEAEDRSRLRLGLRLGLGAARCPCGPIPNLNPNPTLNLLLSSDLRPPSPMLNLFDQIQEAAAAVRTRWTRSAEVGIILGTGLGKLTEDIAAEAVFPYEAIPHFPRSTAPTH